MMNLSKMSMADTPAPLSVRTLLAVAGAVALQLVPVLTATTTTTESSSPLPDAVSDVIIGGGLQGVTLSAPRLACAVGLSLLAAAGYYFAHKVQPAKNVRPWVDIAPGIVSAIFLALALFDGFLNNPIAVPFHLIVGSFPFAMVVLVLNGAFHYDYLKLPIFIDSSLPPPPDPNKVSDSTVLEGDLEKAPDAKSALDLMSNTKYQSQCFNVKTWKKFFDKMADDKTGLKGDQIPAFVNVVAKVNAFLQTAGDSDIKAIKDLKQKFSDYHYPSDHGDRDKPVFIYKNVAPKLDETLEAIKAMNKLPANEIDASKAFSLVVDAWKAVEDKKAEEKAPVVAEIKKLFDLIKTLCGNEAYTMTNSAEAKAAEASLSKIIQGYEKVKDAKKPTLGDIGDTGVDFVFKDIITKVEGQLLKALEVIAQSDLAALKDPLLTTPEVTDANFNPEATAALFKKVLKLIPEKSTLTKLASTSGSGAATVKTALDKHIQAVKVVFTTYQSDATHKPKATAAYNKLKDLDTTKYDGTTKNLFETPLVDMMTALDPNVVLEHVATTETAKVTNAAKTEVPATLAQALIDAAATYARLPTSNATAGVTKAFKDLQTAMKTVYDRMGSLIATALTLKTSKGTVEILTANKGKVDAWVTALNFNLPKTDVCGISGTPAVIFADKLADLGDASSAIQALIDEAEAINLVTKATDIAKEIAKKTDIIELAPGLLAAKDVLTTHKLATGDLKTKVDELKVQIKIIHDKLLLEVTDLSKKLPTDFGTQELINKIKPTVTACGTVALLTEENLGISADPSKKPYETAVNAIKKVQSDAWKANVTPALADYADLETTYGGDKAGKLTVGQIVADTRKLLGKVPPEENITRLKEEGIIGAEKYLKTIDKLVDVFKDKANEALTDGADKKQRCKDFVTALGKYQPAPSKEYNGVAVDLFEAKVKEVNTVANPA